MGGHIMNADDLKKLTTESLNELAALLEQGHSQRLTSLLKMMARFHRYSLHNVCLIVSQRPGASRVAGFHTWRTIGRYRRPITDFSPFTESDDDDVLARIFRFEPLLQEQLKRGSLEHVVNLCREATALAQVLGRPERTGPPQYRVASPRNTADAIVQGEQVADQERQRLGLGTGSPIGHVPDLLASQGVRLAIAPLPEEALSIFLRHRRVGSLIISGPENGEDPGWFRFGLLHAYAFALFDSEPSSVQVTTVRRSDELEHIRASAFVAAFLLPRSGLEAAMAGLDKGRPSRRALAVFGLAVEEVAEVVVRSAPGSQTLTCHDVALIAWRFGASYERTVYRLRSLDLISGSETERLLNREAQGAAAVTNTLLLARPTGDQPRIHDDRMPLKSEVALSGIEAYRRQLISKADLAVLATKLKLPGLTSAKLLELAEAAR
jgi:hypothetical protein